MTTLNARALKCTLVLDPNAVLTAIKPLQRIEARIPFRIAVDDRMLSCDFAPKAVRKAFNMIEEHGTDAVTVLIQGRLGSGDLVLEAGLVVQLKARKLEAA
jgi:hypothetical protein